MISFLGIILLLLWFVIVFGLFLHFFKKENLFVLLGDALSHRLESLSKESGIAVLLLYNWECITIFFVVLFLEVERCSQSLLFDFSVSSFLLLFFQSKE